jgi:cystathionine beta-lyase family protein involved in aluminum resistance
MCIYGEKNVQDLWLEHKEREKAIGISRERVHIQRHKNLISQIVHVIVIVDAIYSEVIWKVDGLYDG